MYSLSTLLYLNACCCPISVGCIHLSPDISTCSSVIFHELLLNKRKFHLQNRNLHQIGSVLCSETNFYNRAEQSNDGACNGKSRCSWMLRGTARSGIYGKPLPSNSRRSVFAWQGVSQLVLSRSQWSNCTGPSKNQGNCAPEVLKEKALKETLIAHFQIGRVKYGKLM